jgi:hypothetical protein
MLFCGCWLRVAGTLNRSGDRSPKRPAIRVCGLIFRLVRWPLSTASTNMWRCVSPLPRDARATDARITDPPVMPRCRVSRSARLSAGTRQAPPAPRKRWRARLRPGFAAARPIRMGKDRRRHCTGKERRRCRRAAAVSASAVRRRGAAGAIGGAVPASFLVESSRRHYWKLRGSRAQRAAGRWANAAWTSLSAAPCSPAQCRCR